jgi:hypothetical protein
MTHQMLMQGSHQVSWSWSYIVQSNAISGGMLGGVRAFSLVCSSIFINWDGAVFL